MNVRDTSFPLVVKKVLPDAEKAGTGSTGYRSSRCDITVV